MEETPKKPTRKNYYQLNKDKFRSIAKRYYQERGGKELKKQYYQANKEVIIQRSKERYEANKEDILETKRLKLIEQKLSQLKVEEEQDGQNSSNNTIATTQPTK